MTTDYARGVMFALRVLTRDKQIMEPGRAYAALTNAAMGALGTGSEDVRDAMRKADAFFEGIGDG